MHSLLIVAIPDRSIVKTCWGVPRTKWRKPLGKLVLLFPGDARAPVLCRAKVSFKLTTIEVLPGIGPM